MVRGVTRPMTGRGLPAPSAGRRRAGRVAGLVVAVLLVLAPVGTASAHDALVGSDPTDGAVLPAAPTAVVLTFAADPLGVGAAVAVAGPDGTSWSAGDPVVTGATVTQTLQPAMPNGTYSVEWRSVSGDGHPISGTLSFTVDAPAPAAGVDPVAAEATAQVTTEATATAAVTASARPTLAAAQGDEQSTNDGSGSGPFFIWPVVVLLALTAVTVAVRRRAQS